MAIDARPVLAMFEKIERSYAFGLARGLTRTAQAAAAVVKAEMPSRFDRPTPFTQQGIGIVSATRTDLVATVYVKDVQAAYLTIEETGGERMPKRGSPINVPAKLRPNVYGNIPRGKIKALLAQDDVFLSRGTGRTKKLAKGIYRRAKVGKRRDGSVGAKGALRKGGKGKAIGGSAARGATTLELLIAFKPRAVYRPRFGFRQTVLDTARREGPAMIAASIADAIASTR